MNRTILVIDDEITISKMLSLVLRKRGFEVISTTDPRQVDSILEVIKPALIIVDYMMPEINGLELSRYLRTRPSARDIPIYMLSALNDTTVMRASAAAGIDEYFSKDEMTGRLISTIEEALRRPILQA